MSRWFLAAALLLTVGCGNGGDGAARSRSAGAPPAPATPSAPASSEPVRMPVAAGRFYPADAAELKKAVKGFLDAAKPAKLPGRVVAVTAPHAGYVYSGAVAAAALKQLDAAGVETVVLLGGHPAPYSGHASIWPKGSYRTPLGEALVDTELAAAMMAATDKVADLPAAHARDHALEVEVPFIQVAFPMARIVPIHVWTRDAAAIDEIASALASAMKGRKAVILNSTDLTHYPDHETAVASDGEFLKALSPLDAAAVFKAEKDLERKYADSANYECSVCCSPGVAVTVAAAKKLGATQAVIIMHATSGDAGPRDRTSVVGYGAVAYCAAGEAPAEAKGESMSISTEGRRKLLAMAKESIALALDGKDFPEPKVPEELARPSGVFVTLKIAGDLRGCIGVFEADAPLWKQVAEYARHSAFDDPRFEPLTKQELPKIEVEISVLSRPEPIDDPMKIELGKHGIWIIGAGGRRGTYLPQVATEYHMTKEQFLSDCCARKAGLPADAWKDPKKAKVLVYTAEVFSEKNIEGKQE